MKLGLSRKIVLMVVSLIVVISLGLGLIALETSSKAIINQTEEALLQLSEEGVRYINAVITGNINILQELANRELMQTMDLEIQKDVLKSEVKRLGYEDMGVVNVNGNGHMILSGDTLDLTHMEYIQKALNGQANISDVFISNYDNSVMIVYAAPIRKMAR